MEGWSLELGRRHAPELLLLNPNKSLWTKAAPGGHDINRNRAFAGSRREVHRQAIHELRANMPKTLRTRREDWNAVPGGDPIKAEWAQSGSGTVERRSESDITPPYTKRSHFRKSHTRVRWREFQRQLRLQPWANPAKSARNRAGKGECNSRWISAEYEQSYDCGAVGVG